MTKIQKNCVCTIKTQKTQFSQNCVNNSQTPKDKLVKRQYAKYISKGISLSMMYYNEDSKLYKSYKNTSYCAEMLAIDENGKLITTYCKNRWCLVCNRIKTARLINNYLPQLQELCNPVFVTLTLPTVPIEQLADRIKEMETNWRQMYKLTSKARYKKNYPSFRGIRKAECTIRPNGLYHYHFHLIVENWAVGEWVISQWLKRFPQASPKAQDIRLADEFSHRELFKYAFKSEVKANDMENAKRYDAVFNILRGKRTIQAFGGIRAIEEDFEDDDLNADIVLGEYANRIFKWVESDWYDKDTGEALIGLPIPKKVQKMASYPDKE